MHKPLLALLLCTVHLIGPSARADDFSDALSELLHTARHPYLHHRDLRPEIEVLRAFYRARNYRPAWEYDEKPSRQALQLAQRLYYAANDGLRAADYEGATLYAKLTEAQRKRDDEDRAALDVALSAMALRYAGHLHHGRIAPAAVDFDLNMQRAPLDLKALLERLSTASEVTAVFAAIEPRFNHYRLLKQKLATYRQLAGDERLAVPLPAYTGKSVKPGQPYAGAAALRERLITLGDLAPDVPPDSGVLDQSLVEGLRIFQERHGLAADGALGQRTLAALNTSMSARVRQIELTLERWRWLPEVTTPTIFVNIPQFRLFAFATHEDVEEDMVNMEVVVGQAYPRTRTPVFLAQMRYVVFRPYWDVPHNIAMREILPAIARDPHYLKKNHMELVRGQGDESPVVPATAENLAAVRRGEVRIRQRPGDDNALGEIKFMMPNRHNVYLHSTPARQLFKQARRAFSHGCIRVSDPLRLATYVLGGEPGGWSTEKILAWMQGEPNQRVNLTHPIQVMILYGTAVAAESGRLFFFDDIYGHDRRLEQLLDTA